MWHLKNQKLIGKSIYHLYCPPYFVFLNFHLKGSKKWSELSRKSYEFFYPKKCKNRGKIDFSTLNQGQKIFSPKHNETSALFEQLLFWSQNSIFWAKKVMNFSIQKSAKIAEKSIFRPWIRVKKFFRRNIMKIQLYSDNFCFGHKIPSSEQKKFWIFQKKDQNPSYATV